MSFEKKTFIFILYVHLVYGYLFVHELGHDILWVSDCNTVESPSASMCAVICERSQSCLNFAFNKTGLLCKYNCKVFWSRSSTDDTLIYYERKSKNVAQSKQANGSTIFFGNSNSYKPGFAVDGYLSNKTHAKECYHSHYEVSPWLLIDLQTMTDIDYLKIFNRWITSVERLRDIKIEIDDVDDKCDDYVGPAADAQVVFISCLPTTRGRRVKVYIDGLQGKNTALTICELEIRQFT